MAAGKFRWATRQLARRTDSEDERIGLLLRGPALGVPLWLPQQVWPCSACLRLRSKKDHFLKFQGDMRDQPICDECREDSKVRTLPGVLGPKIRGVLHEGSVVVYDRPVAEQLQRLIEALAQRDPPEEFALALLVDNPGDAQPILEALAAQLEHEMSVDSLADGVLTVDVPPGRVVEMDASSDFTGRTFDVLFYLREGDEITCDG